MSQEFRRTLLKHVCQVQGLWFLSLSLLSALLVLTLFSLVVLETRSDIYALVILNLVIIGSGFALNLGTLYLCTRMESTEDVLEDVDSIEDLDDRNIE